MTVTLDAAGLVAGQARMLKALADGNRLRIVGLLSERGTMTPTELAESIGIPITSVSQALRILNEAGLLMRRREGVHLHYSLSDRVKGRPGRLKVDLSYNCLTN